MSDTAKVSADHLRRLALVYVRQSSAAQVEYNRESTERQYQLAERALELGWKREQVKILDQDLGGSLTLQRVTLSFTTLRRFIPAH
jgi:hypothetical protein